MGNWFCKFERKSLKNCIMNLTIEINFFLKERIRFWKLLVPNVKMLVHFKGGAIRLNTATS